MREFNTAGPVRSDRHYCIPPLERINLAHVLSMIRRQQYFVLHAPRQTGKTSTLLALRDLLNGGSQGEHRCVYVNVGSAQTAGEDVGVGMRIVIDEMIDEARRALDDDSAAKAGATVDPARNPYGSLGGFLSRLSKADPKPLVLLIDEMDALPGDTLISVLRQLRARYPDRPAHAPASVVLCGIGDVRDYGIHVGSGEQLAPGGGVFNIKSRSLRMDDFDRAEVEALLGQHTAETGQEFLPEAIAAVWEQTHGQPWLVNSLAREMCFERGQLRLRERPLTEVDVLQAREALILRRDTHLEQLADKVREPRVRRVIEPLIGPGLAEYSAYDLEYARALGLVAPDPPLRIANPIYGEMVPRRLQPEAQ